ncbi:thiol-disulfide isomerase/thioredoxin [Agromyces terreus]|uniref:Thiol-disulfide isomerase/thioredoxin n=1 Tax=Agromyces terreus TaxID=424795 RepID=A0A9X2KB68_9MICO|nr:TlpA disulfide reductase family protein [Agromyces terreus]MCP2370031.1 thiol-disulfide isomerase/thioredoxin [Agromyces terreus]
MPSEAGSRDARFARSSTGEGARFSTGGRGGRFSTGVAALVAASALLLTGCSTDPLADQFREGSGKNYIAGDGSISEFAADDRGEPITFGGETVEGDEFDSADTLGEVTVVNFWYAGCAPCRVESPVLEEVHQSYAPDEVAFIGVNVRDQADTAAAFEQTYGVTYPSIIDVESGEAQLAFAGPVPPSAVPTTIVLDQQGRVAARVLGQVTDTSILSSLVDRVLDEQA